MDDRRCSAYRTPTNGDGRCLNGFPQMSAICWGGNSAMASTPHCQRVEWAGLLFERNGGAPANLPSKEANPHG